MKISCALPVVADTKPISCAEFWFNRYQTLVAGIIALVGAAATILAVRYQTLSADRVARRNEKEAEISLREIIRARTTIFAEVWPGIDWVFEPGKADDVKKKRAKAIFGVFWHSGEDRIELNWGKCRRSISLSHPLHKLESPDFCFDGRKCFHISTLFQMNTPKTLTLSDG